MQLRSKNLIAGATFLLGVLITLTLAGLTAWASFEGLAYFSTGAGYDPFGGMHCPILISTGETGVVTADFTNSTDQTQQPYYEVEISGITAARSLEDQITVPPHTTGQASWTVTTADIDVPPFIFVKMDILPIAEYATREATCGILVANLGSLSGGLVLAAGVVMGLICLLASFIVPALGLTAGEATQFDTQASSNPGRASQALGLTAALALLSGLLSWWVPATVLIAIGLLLIPVALPAMLFRR